MYHTKSNNSQQIILSKLTGEVSSVSRIQVTTSQGVHGTWPGTLTEGSTLARLSPNSQLLKIGHTYSLALYQPLTENGKASPGTKKTTARLALILVDH